MKVQRLAVLWMLIAGPASAETFVPDRAVIIGRVADGPWTDRPTEARIDQKAELAVAVFGKRAGKRVVLASTGVHQARIAGRRVIAEPLPAATQLQWSTVEPHGFRATRSLTGATSEFYSNVSTEPKSFGKWLGYDRIDYFERVIAPWGAASVVAAVISSGEPGAIQVAGLGTVRYKIEVEIDGKRVSTAGTEATDRAGMLPSVHRVSIRKGDDFLGHLSSYLLVPEVFGSAGIGTGHQADRYVGADCADVLIGAARRSGRSYAYTNVAGLSAYATVVAKPTDLDDNGVPAHSITGIKPGDIIRIDYGGDRRGATPRGWDHVAAVWEDKSDPNGPSKGGPDGKLDGFDLIIHMGHPRLIIERLAEQAPATIDVLRWR